MFQNIKVDIIYYKTATDFEMEFNLSGCCRMRLLTDKAPDRKTLVNQLVRAVSRSRIIMIAGALFGEDGIIETCAKAVSRPLTSLNNQQFGISGEDDIKIIKDAIPLVSSDGIFGGCIIEQGPQTLILLSENKNIRKNIMQNLIHPYVKEVCAGELTEKSNGEDTVSVSEALPEAVNEEIAEDVEQLQEQMTTEIGDEDFDMEADCANAEEISEAENNEPDEDLTNQLIVDYEEDLPQVVDPNANKESEIKNNKDKSIFSFVNSNDNEEYTYDAIDEFDYTNLEKKPSLMRGINIPIIIITILLLAVVAVLCYSIFVVPTNEGVTAGRYLKEIADTLFG